MIDSLGAGGAQKQLVILAHGLKAKGHDVELCVYFPQINFFRDEIKQSGIKIHDIQKKCKFSLNVIYKIATLIKKGKYDSIISFLDTPNFYSTIAKIISLTKIFLIVCERSSRIYSGNKMFRIQHLLANKIVANSFDHGEWLKSFPNLKKKVNIIYNGYEIPETSKSKPNIFNANFLVIGRIDSGKNGFNLIKALIKLFKTTPYSLNLKWVGQETNDPKSISYRQQMEDLLADNPEVSNCWEWLGKRKNIFELLENADALIHISLYEGLPNAICEALVAGRPVIASNVCDHSRLVQDGVRGFLCDPKNPLSICKAITRLYTLKHNEIVQMSENCKSYARKNLSLTQMVNGYEILIQSGVRYKK